MFASAQPIDRSQAPRRRHGFTLVELMVVIAIVGVFAVMASPRMIDVNRRAKVHSARKQVAQILRRARVIAIRQHKRVKVKVTANQIYLRACPAQYVASTCTSAGWSDLPYRLNVNDGDLRGITLTGPGTDLLFNANGIPATLQTYVYNIAHSQIATSPNVVVSAGGEVVSQ